MEPGSQPPQGTDPLVDAKAQALALVERYGRERIALAGCGLLGALGTLLPFAAGGNPFGGASSFTLMQFGFWGFVMLLIPLALGALPFLPIMLSHSRMTLAFGVSCALLGVFVAMWMAGSEIAAFAGGAIGFAFGFYCSLIGYAGLAVLYFRRVVAD